MATLNEFLRRRDMLSGALNMRMEVKKTQDGQYEAVVVGTTAKEVGSSESDALNRLRRRVQAQIVGNHDGRTAAEEGQ